MSHPEFQDYLYSLEERLFHPEREHDRTVLLPFFADEYREFCTSGRIFNRQQTIDVLLTSEARAATIHHFYVERLADNVALATYRATTEVAVSHRSSLWIFRDNRWQLVFHQGTFAS